MFFSVVSGFAELSERMCCGVSIILLCSLFMLLRCGSSCLVVRSDVKGGGGGVSVELRGY